MRVFLRLLFLPFLLGLLSSCSVSGFCPVPDDRPVSEEEIEKALLEAIGQDEQSFVCSFNIQFLGYSEIRDNAGLASVLERCDIVFIQELVSPPYPGVYPDGSPYKPDPEARAFFTEMKKRGFSYWLSEEDTGPGERIHSNSSRTEWWVAFFKPSVIQPAIELPYGFLAKDRSNNPHFERVPYAFPFKIGEGGPDIVFISVHFPAGEGDISERKRKEELEHIFKWISEHNEKEKDFVILGDLNINSKEELKALFSSPYLSLHDVTLNDTCLQTNTHPIPKCYDHVIFNLSNTPEIGEGFSFSIIDLKRDLEEGWSEKYPGVPYPGRPYVHRLFRRYYSDHQPILFRVWHLEDDD